MVTLITGHYGSGKTAAAAAISAVYAKKGSTALVDMDTVNPYFRAADLAEALKEYGAEVIAPMYANTNLDVPVLNFDLYALANSYDNLVIDMGGDDAGATPYGKYAAQLAANFEVQSLFTVNFMRPLTETPEEAAEQLRQIETACRTKMTGLINNTNLAALTDESIIRAGMEKAETLSQLVSLPVVHTCIADFADIPDKTGFMIIDRRFIANVSGQ